MDKNNGFSCNNDDPFDTAFADFISGLTWDERVFLVKRTIDSTIDIIRSAYGVGRTVQILTDILNNSEVYGPVGKAYLAAPNSCTITTSNGLKRGSINMAAEYLNISSTENHIIAIDPPSDDDVQILTESYKNADETNCD